MVNRLDFRFGYLAKVMLSEHSVLVKIPLEHRIGRMTKKRFGGIVPCHVFAPRIRWDETLGLCRTLQYITVHSQYAG